MTFAHAERIELCDLFLATGPDAPTLCEGWSTHDLAAHLWIRETDPLGATGIMAKPLASFTDRRMAETKARWPYPELVERLRLGPNRFSLFAIPGVDEAANATEYFVHHEDVRRAGDRPAAPRELGPDTQDWIWRRLKLMSRVMFRDRAAGVVLERADADHETVRAAAGDQTVTIIGLPAELLLYASGRRQAAVVDLVGDPDVLDSDDWR
ncbi:TIGR03085 family metal-binding protein [Microlunatus sp. Y2014]|uniref:TIGR03085 family metal-binding protein n=1 Tax=Microlunatus sp. Y2014 TaxID=3418488 RepID=UPI003DA75FFA